MLPTPGFLEDLGDARSGSRDALGHLLDQSYSRLTHIVNGRRRRTLIAKGDDEDIVQMACVEAQRCLGKFRGGTELE